MAITKNIVTDYSCPTDGVSDCRAAFLLFKADAQGQTATLNIPAGTYNFKANTGAPANNQIFSGIPNLTVNMTGATLTDDSGAGGFDLGCIGLDYTVHNSPRINAVLAGATSVVCKTPTDAGKFTVGNWALITGFDCQGTWQSGFGAPPNPQWFEYVMITATNTSTGQVSFSNPLVNSYKDTWPNYSQGATDGPDQGGPATMYVLDASWSSSRTFNGGTFYGTNAAVNCAGMTVIFNGGSTPSFSINPSVNGIMRFINFTLGFMEVDKLVGQLSFEGSSTANQVQCQSASVNLLYLTGTTNISNVNGTPKRMLADPGTTIGNITPGANFYGRSDEITLTGCTVTTFGNFGGQLEQGTGAVGVNVAWTMVNGIIMIPNTHGACGWAVPGTRCFLTGSGSCVVPFLILDVTQDVTNTYVKTTLSGTWPTTLGAKLNIQVHPCPRAAFDPGIISSDLQVRDLCQSTYGRPMYEYTKRTYAKADTAGVPANPKVFGKLNFIRINVITPYAGTQPTLTLGYNFNIIGLDKTNNIFTGIVDLRTAGLRQWAPSGATGLAGIDTVQNLPYPNGYNWLASGFSLNPNHDVSAEVTPLSFSVEVSANQDALSTIVPLGFRIHA